MISPSPLFPPHAVRAKINAAYHAPEYQIITERLQQAYLDEKLLHPIRQRAHHLIETVRHARKKSAGLDAFLTEYALSSQEGIALMCLAEALLRIPDQLTVDALIKDKLAGPNWAAHAGQSHSFFINASTWALMLTGKILQPGHDEAKLSQTLHQWLMRSSESVIRAAVKKMMHVLSHEFVMGATMKQALKRAKKREAQGYRYSYDMLGEAAITEEDAERYYQAYEQAILTLGADVQKSTSASKPSPHHHRDAIHQHPSISIKLSALHPRYAESQKEQVLRELTPKLLKLAQTARQLHIGLTIDAEESERLDLSLDIIEKIFKDPSLRAWNGLGLAVQSYQKRALHVIEWAAELARTQHERINIRLIKGAYWDSEIKKAQMLGFRDYPVFTRKVFTDVSFQACAIELLKHHDVLYPQFATHNAYTVAMIIELTNSLNIQDFEFQCLHGMGQELYQQIVPASQLNRPCRIYAPVGSHQDLLPYLVRRLLENGANSSFVNRVVDEKAPIETLIEDPIRKATQLLDKINHNIPLPQAIFWPNRLNSFGLDFTDRQIQAELQSTLNQYINQTYEASPWVAEHNDDPHRPLSLPVHAPQDIKKQLGTVQWSSTLDVDIALSHAVLAFKTWSKTSVHQRAKIIESIAQTYEQHQNELLALLCLEAGKTLPDALGEIREAIDFCHYYAHQAIKLMGQSIQLHGYTGENNTLSWHPRGPMLCISPWNFPLAIFTGQIVACLVTGNPVIAKPAEQTSIIGWLAVKLMHASGVPSSVLQYLPGPGETIGDQLSKDERIKGILFTGSTQTAQKININCAQRTRDIIPFIAETGGLNAMIVDSSALLEQVVMDSITSAFGSAGQRCSALRLLLIQQEVYPRAKELLIGAMKTLTIGDPQYLATDLGPVIDETSLKQLKQYVKQKQDQVIYQCDLKPHTRSGYFMPPTLIELNHPNEINQEMFGPILHLCSFRIEDLDALIDDINQTGYGLTFGVHSRIQSRTTAILNQIHAGNAYVNRNMIGAVVGLQPFGGEGLSGTGPKAGGPHYLQRLCVERTVTTDTTASGGNASLMSVEA